MGRNKILLYVVNTLICTLEGESEEEELSGDEKEESEDDEDQGVMSENKYAYTSEPQG